MKTPDPGLDGTPYHWPAALSWSNVSQDAAEDMEKALHLAFVAVHDAAREIAEDFLIIVTTPTASQAIDARPIGLDVQVVRSATAVERGLSRKEVTREVERLYRAQLHHPAMPDNLDAWRAYRSVFTNKTETRTKLVGLSFFEGRCGQGVSSHDRMAAFAYFDAPR